jgi:hypothetical protein
VMIVTHKVSQRVTVLLAADRIDLLGYVGHRQNGYLNRCRMFKLSRYSMDIFESRRSRGSAALGASSVSQK